MKPEVKLVELRPLLKSPDNEWISWRIFLLMGRLYSGSCLTMQKTAIPVLVIAIEASNGLRFKPIATPLICLHIPSLNLNGTSANRRSRYFTEHS